MCGLGGYLGDPRRPRPLDTQALTLRHRGPDDQRALPFAAADGTPGLLAFARLAIIDLSPLGAQPMHSDDGTRALIYNGETYNYTALRDELGAAGSPFRSRSDTEVVLRAYEAFGAAAFARLRGMYALALWDGQQQELLLARDPLGIKPLYYCYDGERLVFASEVRALLAAGAVAPRLDPRAVHGFLSLGAVPEPLTLIAGVMALPPGHLLRVQARHGHVLPPLLERIGAPPREPHFLHAPAAGAQLADKAQVLAPLLVDTVRAHLAADVPVALLLSGGVDSTAVAALARQAAPAAQLASFTLTYGDDDPHSEGAVARRTAQALGLIHQDCAITANAALAALPRFLAAQDQPSSDGFNTFLISEKLHAAGYKVALSGLGGDELFHGYGLHHAFAATWLLGELGSGLPEGLRIFSDLMKTALEAHDEPAVPTGPHPMLASAMARLRKGSALLAATAWPRGDRAVALYTRLRMLWSPAEVAALLDPTLGTAGLSPEAQLPLPAALLAALSALQSSSGRQATDPSLRTRIRFAYHVVMQLERHSYLRDTLLRDADALSMAHGVELRVPLCDDRLWQAVTDLGPEPALRPKKLLVAATQQPLVAAAAARRKRGFALPLHRWLRGELRSTVSAYFANADLCRRAGLTTAAPRAWARYLDQPDERMLYRVWSLFTLLAYVERHGLHC